MSTIDWNGIRQLNPGEDHLTHLNVITFKLTEDGEGLVVIPYLHNLDTNCIGMMVSFLQLLDSGQKDSLWLIRYKNIVGQRAICLWCIMLTSRSVGQNNNIQWWHLAITGFTSVCIKLLYPTIEDYFQHLAGGCLAYRDHVSEKQYKELKRSEPLGGEASWKACLRAACPFSPPIKAASLFQFILYLPERLSALLSCYSGI